MCLYPKQQLNPKYLPTRKNGFNPPPLKDIRLKYIIAECGRCMQCRRTKANGWKIRLMEEIRKTTNGKFGTFTFSEESYNKIKEIVINERNEEILEISKTLKRNIEKKIKPIGGYELENAIVQKAWELFKDRYRKQYNETLRYWYVTELGKTNTERIHIHSIIFTDKPKKEVSELWEYGFLNEWDDSWKGNYVSERTVNYCMKYVNKVDQLHKAYKPITRASKRPGIGLNYLSRSDSKRNKFKGDKTELRYTDRKGYRVGMPKYLKDKLYDDNEREQLRQYNLDTGKVWINGLQVNADPESEEHKSILNMARGLSTMLGYGKRLTEEEIKVDQSNRELRKLKRLKKITDLKYKSDKDMGNPKS